MLKKLLSAAVSCFVSFKKSNSKSKITWMGLGLAMSVVPAPVSLAGISATGDVSPTDPSTWTSDTTCYVGNTKDGSLTVDNGSDLLSYDACLGCNSGVTGDVTIDGAGTNWTISRWFDVGLVGSGTLTVKNGGTLNSNYSYIGRHNSITANSWASWVTVEGEGSTWDSNSLFVGFKGNGELNISNGGLVSTGKLGTPCGSVVNMDSGGMLALKGKADESITNFLSLVTLDTGSIRYWDDASSSWQNITNAIQGEDYTLAYLTSGDLMGYTVMTVTAVPEPMTMSLLAIGGLAMLRRRK